MTNARVPGEPFVSSEVRPCWSVTTEPQSPSGNDVPTPGATACPWTTRPDTPEPPESPDDFVELAEALALAVTVPMVTSPPKIEIVETSAEEVAVAAVPGFAKAPEVTEPALTTVPSEG